jgi:hypothetical protein
MPDKADIQTEMDLFTTLESGETVSQFALAKRLSVSVGLINALLKRAARKGLAKAKAVPPQRWAYYLTAKGFMEKSRLVAAYLDRSLVFFREARAGYAELFDHLQASGVRRIVLVGQGELAEIAILAKQDADVEIIGVLAFQSNNERLHGLRVLCRLDEVDNSTVLVITDARAPQAAYDEARVQYGTFRIEAPAFLRISASPLPKVQS